VFLGVGPDYDTNALDTQGDIAAVTPTISLPAGTDPASTAAFLTLTANDNAKVSAAWVDVRAPGITFLETGAATEQVQIDPNLDRQALIETPGDWIRSYTGFTNIGRYEVFYFVQDTLTGNVSQAQRSVVYKDYTGNTPPATFDLLTPADGATRATALLFDWGSSSDSDGLTYTLEIATDSGFTNIIHRQEELQPSHAYVGPGAGLQSGTHYWRVYAVDSFGAKTLGTPGYRMFVADNTNNYLGFVSGTVRDAANFVGLDGAVVTPVKPGGTDPVVLDYAEHNGSFLIAVDPAGTYTLTATVAGYAADSRAGVAITPVENSGQDILLTSTATDTDLDGLPDTVETNTGTYNSPTDTGTDPNVVDTDGDGLDDGDEISQYNTNPTRRDSDGDGFGDDVELGAGTLPNDPAGPWPAADGDLAPLGLYDGVVNVADYLVAQRMALGLEPQDELAIAHGDVMSTGASAGIIDTADVLLILQQALNGP
jgi:hypothetical protein